MGPGSSARVIDDIRDCDYVNFVLSKPISHCGDPMLPDRYVNLWIVVLVIIDSEHQPNVVLGSYQEWQIFV